MICDLRKTIIDIIEGSSSSADKSLEICCMLDNEFELQSLDAFDDDEELNAALARFYDRIVEEGKRRIAEHGPFGVWAWNKGK